MRNQTSITSLLILFPLLIFAHTSVAFRTYAQLGTTATVDNSSPQAEVKITSLKQNQTVPSGEFVIKGVSSDTAATNCQVAVDWNDAKPMQNVTPTGTGGKDDYSSWTFTYAKNYHLITEGTNELTSKISCPIRDSQSGNISKKFYTVNITGTNASVPIDNNQSSKISIPLNALGTSASDNSSKHDLSYSSYKNSSGDLSTSKIHGVGHKALLPQYSQSSYSYKSQATDHTSKLPALTNTTEATENNSTIPALTNTNTTRATGCNSTLPAFTNVTAAGDYNSTIPIFTNATDNACRLPGIDITQAVTTTDETEDGNDGENNGEKDKSGDNSHDSDGGSDSSNSNSGHENHDNDNHDESHGNHDSHSNHNDGNKGHEHDHGNKGHDHNDEGSKDDDSNDGNEGDSGAHGNGGHGNGGNSGNNDNSRGNS